MRLAKLNCPHPRPTPTQRQTVSTYIGRHFRNRSAPAKRRPPPQLLGPSAGADGQQVVRESRRWADSPESARSRPGNVTLLLRPVVECFVPAYPTEHRQNVSHVLDFHIHYLAARLTHWGTGPTPFMRCWVQMVCGDMALFDSVATFTHGVRITTLEDKVTPSATMLWHKARALKGLQAKVSTEAEDKAAIWTASETILATFYLMEGAARFGYESEFKAHCLVASACLKDLYVMQAVGLVEGTEMASELRHGIIQDGHQSSNNEPAAVTSITTRSELRYLRPGLQLEEPLRAMIDTLPVGFRDLVALGNLSIEFILLLEEQLQHGTTNQGVKRARVLANQSQNAVEHLASLGIVAFLTRHTAQMQMFPKISFLDKLTMLGRQMASSGQAGTSCYSELRVWATLVGTEIATTAGATLRQRAHDAMTKLLLQERWIDGWNDVERIARGYLWDEKTLTAWNRYWMSCQDMS
ncbi:hypothetical protein POJ06DRAFT_279701 [Lipomyces tetrasporus]|uniref:Uncharacterized protein n=1 Tax=Lipomyces tetrasporus TaxID=54092 RepID=A0AAD7QZA0_9ASCO|nr:uncharacterized protein POJ06DRAFT_279701 [Lipomyces tetrasporus]KAJ8104209.1 hypothetical protein POJ06DRAFT_279701 [Lipomyces tetrasporus]